MHQNVPVPRFKLSSFSHFVTTASSYPKPEPTALRGRRQKRATVPIGTVARFFQKQVTINKFWGTCGKTLKRS